MKFGSLFTGIGGFDLGFERAGLECAWQVEIDKDCKRVLGRHWPSVQRFDDVTTVRKFSAVDVICGGFPCQDVSVAGKRAGLAGERSGLWFEFLRIIKANQPRWIVIENVPGLLSSDEGRDFAAILSGLVEFGYCLAWRVLDAQYFGVAQRRRRVFIVGSLGNGSAAKILFESESVSRNPPTRGEARTRIANAVTTGTGKSSGPRNGNGEPLHLIDVAATLDQRGRGPTGDSVMMNLQIGHRMTAFGEYEDDDTASSLKQRDFKDATDLVVTHALRSEGADASEDGTGRGTPIVAVNVRDLNIQPDEISGTLQSKKSGGHSLNYQNPVFTIQHAQVGRNDGAGPQGKGYQEEIAFTIDSRPTADVVAFSSKEVLGLHSGASHSYQGIGGNFGVRRLTPTECERLQGFPDDYTRWDGEGKEISDSARYRMLGNAVEVDCAEWIGRRIA